MFDVDFNKLREYLHFIQRFDYKKYGNYETGCPYGTVNKNAMDYAKVNKSVYDTLHLVYGIAVANTFITQIQSAYKQYLTKPEG